MGGFKLDTSGEVGIMPAGRWNERFMRWSDLSPFAQGYIEAAFESVLSAELFAERAGWSWSATQEGWIEGPNDLVRGRTASDACIMSCIDVEPLGFSDLAPATLAAMLEDCERALATKLWGNSAIDGGVFWSERMKEAFSGFYNGAQADLIHAFPPVTLYLAHDGKVHQREGA